METTVAKMTPSELRQLIGEVVEEKLARFEDPDKGLEITESLKERLLDQRRRMMEGERGVPMEDVIADLGLD